MMEINANVAPFQPTMNITRPQKRGSTIGEPTVFVVDGDPSTHKALSRLLGERYAVQAYASAASFMATVEPMAPGCIVLELALPDVSGLDFQAQLIEAGWLQPVIFVSGYGSVGTSVQAMRAGALDFFEKPWEDVPLIESIGRALERDREARMRRETAAAVSRRMASLTPRETEVFRHVIAGRLNKQIAVKLCTAEKTVKVHRARVMHKMFVRSVAELTRLAEFMNVLPEA